MSNEEQIESSMKVQSILQSVAEATAGFSEHEADPNTDPDSCFWKNAPSVRATLDTYGNEVPGHATEVRVIWTPHNLYFLFICPYMQLNLKSNPETDGESFQLWNWDVAEVFIGSDFNNIRRYREFEVSPQGEWVDLDIDLDAPNPVDGWRWNSGCAVAARIDESSHVWFGFMRIPYSAIDTRPAAAGNLLRINFFRSQGPEPHRREIAWQPTHHETFHVPESFGTLKLDPC